MCDTESTSNSGVVGICMWSPANNSFSGVRGVAYVALLDSADVPRISSQLEVLSLECRLPLRWHLMPLFSMFLMPTFLPRLSSEYPHST
jgi:hypothetical protein